LICTERSVMHFLEAFHQPEAGSKLIVERVGVVPRHLKPTTFGRTFRSKCGNDYVGSTMPTRAKIRKSSRLA
jgi:hypothetical protein